MLKESTISSFIDKKHNLTLHLLDGQKLISDLVATHAPKGLALNFFRDAILASQTLLSFLKQGESFGIYIESTEPEFNFKIESSTKGMMRTLLTPKDFQSFPQKITGRMRVNKILPNNSTPYESIIQLKNNSLEEVFNKLLSQSYQVDARILLSKNTDQSLLAMKLPALGIDLDEDFKISPENYLSKIESDHEMFFDQEFNIENISEYFKTKEIEYMAKKDIRFFCWCHKSRFVEGIKSLSKDSIKKLFKSDQSVEIKCEYCHQKYQIDLREVL